MCINTVILALAVFPVTLDWLCPDRDTDMTLSQDRDIQPGMTNYRIGPRLNTSDKFD